MNTKYSWFQKFLEEDYQPGAYCVKAQSEQDAIQEVKQIAINSKTLIVTILFAYENKNPDNAYAICGWKKGSSGTVKELPNEEVSIIFKEFEAKQKLFRCHKE